MAVAPRDRHPHKSRAPPSAIPATPPAPALSPHSVAGGSEAQGPLFGSYEVNERCIEMLVNAARHEQDRPFALVSELRTLLRSLDPPTRQRAARAAFVLVDMEFANPDWWHTAHHRPLQQMRTPLWRGCFPRPTGIQLARATLLLAWNSLRADPVTARILLGMAPGVSDVIAGLRFDEIDRIAQKHFRHVRPRWDDRPAVWRRLLLAAQGDDEKLMGEFNLQGIQLLVGELLPGNQG
jgi:hypothetical protein